MKRYLCLDKCGDDWDWYALHWDNFHAVNSASIEGDADEWRQVADAIERGESVSFKRVSFQKESATTWLVSSPRNSTRATLIPDEGVRALVPVIRAAIADAAKGGA